MKVIDLDVYPWGHILADQFVLTDNRNEDIYNLSSTSTLLADLKVTVGETGRLWILLKKKTIPGR